MKKLTKHVYIYIYINMQNMMSPDPKVAKH